MKLVRLVFLAVVLASAGTSADASRKDRDPRPEIISGSFFLHYHPDIRFRRLAFQAFEEGDHGAAVKHFEKAAWFSDKPSQAMLSEMHWDGLSGPANRPLAYAWMDLAAERGYVLFVARREKYWQAMTPEEKQAALEVGQDLYRDYGDEVAMDRLARKIRQGARKTTGSRVGYVGNLKIYIPSPTGGWMSIPVGEVYDERFWRPKQYFSWQQRMWDRPPTGIVEVGPVGLPGDDFESQEPAKD